VNDAYRRRWSGSLDALDRLLDGTPSDRPGTGVTPEWKQLYEKYTRSGVPSGAPIPGDSLG
jgi:hypothetical protein